MFPNSPLIGSLAPFPRADSASSSHAVLNVAIFYIFVCVFHTMTVHNPMPTPTGRRMRQIGSMMLSPVTAGLTSFHSIIFFATKIPTREWQWPWRHSPSIIQDAISAGAVAIPIPNKSVVAIVESPFGWRKLETGIPIIEVSTKDEIANIDSTVDESTTLYVLPPLCRLHTDSLKTVSSSNKLNTILALFQLFCSVTHEYLQYGPSLRVHGLSSPYIFAIPYIYMTLINLVANLVQGSYSHITVLRPRRVAPPQPSDHVAIYMPGEIFESPEDPVGSVAGEQPSAPLTAQSLLTSPEEIVQQFEEWLQLHYPELHIEEHPSYLTVVNFLHYLSALVVVLTCIWYMTRPRPVSSDINISLLMSVISDPIAHLIVILGSMRVILLKRAGEAGMVNVLVCVFNIIGCLYAGKLLYNAYIDH